MDKNIDVIIPAYNPDDKLLELARTLLPLIDGRLVVVDDGSAAQAAPVFEALADMDVCLLRHAVNLGKGRALKTAFNHCLLTNPALVGVVTADADGQHAIEDILACGDALAQKPEALVMGCRDFYQPTVPWANRTGNVITSKVMGALCGVKVSDTQTGLRAVSARFMHRLMNVPGERFEYETNMLLETKAEKVSIVEVPIQTIYFEGNPSSNFNPLRDSIRIYSLFLKFMAASLSSSVVDILLFALFVALFKPLGLAWYITLATVLSRVLSASFNFTINYRKVFKSQSKVHGALARYAALCVVQMLLSAGLVTGLYSLLPLPEVAIKIVVDICLFFLSYQVQQRYIF